MKIYNELLYHNTESFLLTCFPVVKRMLGERRWNRLYRQFFKTHRSHTPFFRQIPDEFLQFLQTEWQRPADYPEWLIDLAHYEWIELAMAISNRAPAHLFNPDGDLVSGVPVLSPALANLAYRWPVQRIRPRARVRPADTFLLVFRDACDTVQFSEINAFSARLIALLEPAEQTGEACLTQLAEESGHPDPAMVLAGGAQLLAGLRAQGAILGVRRDPLATD
jgi:hypothetical protein